jgi:hypothetical protein
MKLKDLFLETFFMHVIMVVTNLYSIYDYFYG